MNNRSKHHCKYCNKNMYINIHEDETGPFFIKCISCNYLHFREFKKGVAIHCDIRQRSHKKIITIHGKN